MAGLRDMVKMTVSGSPGIGPITVNTAVPGFQTFAAAGVADGTVVSYGAGDNLSNGSYLIWEVGRGTYTGGTLTRSPLWSSDGGTAVNLSSSAVVWITVLAEDLDLSLGGNVAGISSIPLPDITLFGGDNITLSGDSSAISIIGADGITSGNYSAVGNTTGTAASMTVALSAQTLSGAGIVSLGFDAGNIVISATGAASATSMGWAAVGNTTGTTSSMSHALTDQTLSGAGIASIGFNAGSIVVSVPSGGGSATSIGQTALGNTTGVTSSQTRAILAESLSGAGGVSLGFSNDTLVISGATTVASGSVGNFIALGNTTGQTSSSTHTLSLLSVSGAGAVSVGYSTTGAGAGVMIISANTGGTGSGSATSMGLTAVGNTAGTTSSMTHALTGATLSGAGIVSVGFNAGSAVISATVAAQTVQSLGLFAAGNTAGSTTSVTRDARSVSFVGSGVASVGYSDGSIVINAPAAAATNPLLSLFAVGNTTQSTTSGANAPGSMSFAGSGAVSVGLSGSSVVISSPATIASGTVQNRFALGNTVGDTSSTANTLTLLSISGAGGISVGYSSTGAGAGVLILSGATGADASATSMGLSAVGNTAGTTSSQTHALTDSTIRGAGIVSVGFNAGSVVISAVQTNPAISLFASGNTTDSTSSGVIGAGSLTFSGAGIASIGISGSKIIISASSAQSVQTLGLVASSGTAGTTTSQTADARSLTFVGSGVAAVGYSDGSIIISAPAAAATNPLLSIYAVGNTTQSTTSGANAPGSLSFAGSGGISIGISNSSVVISGSQQGTTLSLWEPVPMLSVAANNLTILFGTMQVAPLVLPTPVSFNQVRFAAFRNFGAVSAVISTTAAGSQTATLSAGVNYTQSLAIFSQQTGASTGTFVTMSSTSVSYGLTDSYSISISVGSISASITRNFSWWQGTTTSSGTLTGSTSTAAGPITVSANAVATLNSSRLGGALVYRSDVPFVGSISAGVYVLGEVINSASASGGGLAAVVTAATLAGSAWSQQFIVGVNNKSSAAQLLLGGGAAISYPGIGITSSAGSVLPTSLPWEGLSTQAGNSFGGFPWFQMGVLGS